MADIQRRQVTPPAREHKRVRREGDEERRSAPGAGNCARQGHEEVQEAPERLRLELAQRIYFALQCGLVGAQFDWEELAKDGRLGCDQ